MSKVVWIFECPIEGFEDACAAFPDARRVIADRPTSADEGFARALRGFCDEIG